MIAAVASFILDYVLRVAFGAALPRKPLVAQVHANNIIQLRLRLPSMRCRSMTGGSYIFLNVPAVSPVEWHPFSITSTSRDEFVELHIRASGNWTTALKELVQKRGTDFSVRWTGPHGVSVAGTLETCDTHVFVAGGIGVTALLGQLKEMAHALSPHFQQTEDANLGIQLNPLMLGRSAWAPGDSEYADIPAEYAEIPRAHVNESYLTIGEAADPVSKQVSITKKYRIASSLTPLLVLPMWFSGFFPTSFHFLSLSRWSSYGSCGARPRWM